MFSNKTSGLKFLIKVRWKGFVWNSLSSELCGFDIFMTSNKWNYVRYVSSIAFCGLCNVGCIASWSFPNLHGTSLMLHFFRSYTFLALTKHVVLFFSYILRSTISHRIFIPTIFRFPCHFSLPLSQINLFLFSSASFNFQNCLAQFLFAIDAFRMANIDDQYGS